LEIGLHADDDIIVCCPESFWRRGNVEILCQRKGIPLFDNLEDAIISLKRRIEGEYYVTKNYKEVKAHIKTLFKIVKDLYR
jgi:hypothetical protein